MSIETNCADRLRRAGLRTTKHRVRVLSALEAAARPLTHLEILQTVPENLDRVTLYRILSSLTDASLVHQIQGFDGIWRFCSHEDTTERCPGGHPHLLCTSCATMWCIHGEPLQHVKVPASFKVSHKQMVISGLCAKCQNGKT